MDQFPPASRHRARGGVPLTGADWPTAAGLREELLADGLLAIMRGFDRDGVATIVDALLRAKSAVAEEARRADAFYLPGVTTPTEVGLALRSGIDLQQLFPASLLGPDYLRALVGPYPQLRGVAVGNMTLDRIAPMVRAGAVGVALGGSIFGRAGAPRRLTTSSRWCGGLGSS